jgi:2,4-diketo-3-deoxy-L-fuconate hydrolase
MKLIRWGDFRRERPGVELESGARKDCSTYFSDWNQDFFASEGLERLAKMVTQQEQGLPDVPAEARLGAPVARPGKIVGVGLNYSDHSRESGMAAPSEPLLFMKASTSVVGPRDNIIIPRGSEKLDWEVELGVVIGKETRYLDSPEVARSHVAGYCISHDLSERGFQLDRCGQWTKGKSHDSFNPLGPYLVTRDAIVDPDKLPMSLDVNGERMQTDNTENMVFNADYLVYYISQFMTLEAGDVITTGTPPGVGMGRQPPRYLRAGDVVELWIEGLGNQRQVCVPENGSGT